MTTSIRQSLVGKSLIGFDTRTPRMPGAMVGGKTEIKSAVSQKLANKRLIGFDSRAPRKPGAMVGATSEVKPTS